MVVPQIRQVIREISEVVADADLQVAAEVAIDRG
jgi:hypothetical protein